MTLTDQLRAALIAAMEIVQRDRVRIASKCQPGALSSYAAERDACDRVIAQADAALGSGR